jgi:hypothetical protein
MIDFELQTLQFVTSPNLMENIPVACPQSTKIRTCMHSRPRDPYGLRCDTNLRSRYAMMLSVMGPTDG